MRHDVNDEKEDDEEPEEPPLCLSSWCLWCSLLLPGGEDEEEDEEVKEGGTAAPAAPPPPPAAALLTLAASHLLASASRHRAVSGDRGSAITHPATASVGKASNRNKICQPASPIKPSSRSSRAASGPPTIWAAAMTAVMCAYAWPRATSLPP